MTDEEHKRILAAGVDFYSGLKDVLNKHGLDDSHAASLVLVAAGAILRITNMTADGLAQSADICSKYWYWDPNSELAGCASFEDPENASGN